MLAKIDSTGIKTQATGAGSSVNITEGGRFVLPKGGILRAVSIVSGRIGQSGVKVNVLITLDGFEIELVEGWIRGETDAQRRQSLQWHGELPLPKTRNFVQFAVRNDTGADFLWRGAWVVET